MKYATAYIGLGANLGDPVQQLHQALAAITRLTGTKLVQASSFYRNPAIGPEQPDYVNAVAEILTSLAPLDLLDALQAVERKAGRRREYEERWGPRPLDLDILLYDNKVIEHERLVVPHVEMRHRPFVIFPLLEIAPHITLPTGEPVASLAKALSPECLRKI